VDSSPRAQQNAQDSDASELGEDDLEEEVEQFEIHLGGQLPWEEQRGEVGAQGQIQQGAMLLDAATSFECRTDSSGCSSSAGSQLSVTPAKEMDAALAMLLSTQVAASKIVSEPCELFGAGTAWPAWTP
jgi:hypothetical protein